MSVASFSVKHKVLINLLTISAIIAGAVATSQMRREALPLVQVDFVFVITVYPGSSPREIEQLITIPIEDILKDIEGIDTFNSVSRENVSFIFIELDPDARNRDRVINEIGREVDKVTLPDDCDDPVVTEFILEHPLIEVAFTGENISEDELRQYVKHFEDIIKNIDGVGTITKAGWRDKEIHIEVNPADLEKYHISLAGIINSIKKQNLNLPGGKFTIGRKELIIRTIGEIKNVNEFAEIIIRSNIDGKHLIVGDVAEVRETFKDQDTIHKTNSKLSINLLPRKERTGDIIRIVDEIYRNIEEYRKTLSENVDIYTLNDISFYVKRRLNVLTSNGIIGLILLMLTLLLFLNFRVAMVTAIGIPFAFLTALLLMSFFDVTLNLITMFGLILVLGMIVDDAIIVSENVYRYMEKGMSPADAAVKGANEVTAPIIVAILTTAAAFMPLMFISGIMGKFLRFFPMGVIFCLAASLFEALIILPSHLAEWVKPLKSVEKPLHKIKKSFLAKILYLPATVIIILKHYLFSHERKGSEAKWFKKLLNGYSRLLNFSIRRRYKMCLGAIVVFIGAAVFSVKIMPFNLFPDVIETFYIRIETPDGTSLKETNKVISQIEEIIMRLPEEELEDFTTTVGFSGEMRGGPLDKSGSKYAQCVIYLTPQQDRKNDADTIIAALRKEILGKNIPGISTISFEKLEMGPPVGKPIMIEVSGYEYPTLTEITEKIKTYMAGMNGVEDIKDDYEPGKEEIQISINKREAARLGLSVSQIAQTVRFAFEGGVATTFRRRDEDIEVIVKISDEYKNDIETLKNLTIPNNVGRLIKLNKVAYFDKFQGIRILNRKEGKRTITITANIDKNKITVRDANRKVISEMEDLFKEYQGYHFKIGGEWADTAESIQSMFKAFGIAFILIYMILAVQFRSFIQPLIIMISVPFGIIGVIAALFIHGQPISIMAMFGIIGLTGVVVNDSLLLVNFINKLKEKGTDVIQSVQEAGRIRLRPILLTSITTIVALMPLIYGIGGEEPFLVPAAIAMAYGLLAATFLTLIIVPCVYLITEDITRKWAVGSRQ